jgi:4-hydroxy-tetrahydrodipicolinate synthase
MSLTIDGIVPVMLTPFTEDDMIDNAALDRLVEWYLAHGSDALFAVCQSSEMQFLTLKERVTLARSVCELTAGRVPVVASGHVSESLNDQATELLAMAESGIDGLVLVSNRLDPEGLGSEVFLGNLKHLLSILPPDMPLGLYECPAPFRRLLTDDELKFCRDTGRFAVLKDVACDLDIVKRRAELVKGSPLAIVNANAAIALEAMRAGSKGFAGVMTNFHPDLYAWLYRHSDEKTQLVAELATFLALAANVEPLGYPRMAKIYHQSLGVFISDHTRAQPFDARENFWALDAVLDHLSTGSSSFRDRIAAHDRATE